MPGTPQQTANQIEVREKVVTVPFNTTVPLVEANPSRVGLIISPTHTRGNCLVVSTRPDVSTRSGIPINDGPNIHILDFNWCTHGSLVTCAWYVCPGVGSEDVTVIESIFIPPLE